MGVSISRTPPEALEPQSGPAGAAASCMAGLPGLALRAAPATSLLTNHAANEETVALRATVARVSLPNAGQLQHVARLLRGDHQKGILSRSATPVNHSSHPIVNDSDCELTMRPSLRSAVFPFPLGGSK